MAQSSDTGGPGGSGAGAPGRDEDLGIPPHLCGESKPEPPKPVSSPGPRHRPPVRVLPPPGGAPPGGAPLDGYDQPRRPGLRLLAIAVPVFLVVTLGAVALLSSRRGVQGPTGRGPAAGSTGTAPDFVAPTDPRNVTAPLDGRTEASFDLITETSAVSVRVADLGDELYRISTPAGSDTLPMPRIRDDRVQLQLVPSGGDGPGAVDVELNSEVRWTVRMTGGAVEHLLDLGDAELAGVELLGGATRVELTLPPPDGTLTVRMTGGANQFLVSLPEGPPVRVRVGKGAGRITLDGKRHHGVAPGTVLASRGWHGAHDRYDIDLVGGVATFTVRRS